MTTTNTTGGTMTTTTLATLTVAIARNNAATKAAKRARSEVRWATHDFGDADRYTTERAFERAESMSRIERATEKAMLAAIAALG